MPDKFGVSSQYEGIPVNQSAIGLCTRWQDTINRQVGITVVNLNLQVTPAGSPGDKAFAMLGVHFNRNEGSTMDPVKLRQYLLQIAGTFADEVNEEGRLDDYGDDAFYIGPISAEFRP